MSVVLFTSCSQILFTFFFYQFVQELKICASIINMFYLIPAASSKLIEPLINLILKVEKVLSLEVRDTLTFVYFSSR